MKKRKTPCIDICSFFRAEWIVFGLLPYQIRMSEMEKNEAVWNNLLEKELFKRMSHLRKTERSYRSSCKGLSRIDIMIVCLNLPSHLHFLWIDLWVRIKSLGINLWKVFLFRTLKFLSDSRIKLVGGNVIHFTATIEIKVDEDLKVNFHFPIRL